ncbi:L-lactate dehydrogenase [Naematelia encephala]|uniref:L-lactate dehydrogenase n=1 Tax=Naematelia encephala TaxID=71784 RepID=A0A1Y2BNN7_9TREE|nr:L-lactate dehydrogenase [Naematelia encephala]
MDPSIQPHREPNFALYQKEMFLLSQKGSHPAFSTHPDKLQEEAHKSLSQGGWLYASCNAGIGWTDRANREGKWRIIPRMLRDTTARDTTIELFGHKIAAPICFAPIGINKIYHPLGELNSSKVAGELNIPYCLSTAGSQPIEEVARVNGNGPRFFQLYCPHDEELEDSLLKRAWDSGFDACIFTLDTWQLAWRHEDIAASNYAFYRGIGAEIGLSDPVFKKRIAEAGLDPNKIEDMPKIGEKWIDNVWHGKAWTWEKVPKLVKKWKELSGGRPFLLKGIQHPDDAIKAVECGCDGIVVSNHAGRQVDGAVGSLEMLPEIVEAVGDKCTILFDSGIRTGADVFKALALGAKAVCVGRLFVYGMSIAGEAGVRHVMKSLLADFDILMNCAGVNSIAEIQKPQLRECISYFRECTISVLIIP